MQHWFSTRRIDQARRLSPLVKSQLPHFPRNWWEQSRNGKACTNIPLAGLMNPSLLYTSWHFAIKAPSSTVFSCTCSTPPKRASMASFTMPCPSMSMLIAWQEEVLVSTKCRECHRRNAQAREGTFKQIISCEGTSVSPCLPICDCCSHDQP